MEKSNYELLKSQIPIGIESDPEAQTRIFEHSLAVANVARIIADKLNLPDADQIEAGALFHDITKGEEMKFVKSRGTSFNLSSREKWIHDDRMQKLVISKEIVQLSSATGLPVILREIINGDFLHTLGEKIVFISDQFVKETNIVSPTNRFFQSPIIYNSSEVNALYVYAVICADEISIKMGLKSHLELVEFLKDKMYQK